MKRLIRAFSLAVVLMTAAMAGQASAQKIKIDGAWARLDGNAGEVFVTITNTASSSDQLFAIKTKAAKTAVLHTGSDHSASGKMTRMMALVIPAEGKIVLHPDGRHIMMLGLTGPLKNGDTVTLRLFFKKAGVIAIEAKVR